MIVPWSSLPFLKLLRLKFKTFQDRDCWRKQTFTIFTVCTCPLPATHFRCVPLCDAAVDEPTQRPLHIQPCNHINHICSFLISCQKKLLQYLLSELHTSTSTATAPPSTRSTKNNINSQHNHQKKKCDVNSTTSNRRSTNGLHRFSQAMLQTELFGSRNLPFT